MICFGSTVAHTSLIRSIYAIGILFLASNLTIYSLSQNNQPSRLTFPDRPAFIIPLKEKMFWMDISMYAPLLYSTIHFSRPPGGNRPGPIHYGITSPIDRLLLKTISSVL